MREQKNSFVVLDRDDTIIVDKHYISDPDDVELMNNALTGLRRMQAMGLNLVIATNQSGISRGYFDYEDLHKVNARMLALLGGVDVKGIYFCPHKPSDNCNCRKPETGLFYQAVEDWGFKPEDAFVVGNSPSDVGMGNRVGATTIMVSYYQREHNADYIVRDLLGASIIIGDILDLQPSIKAS